MFKINLNGDLYDCINYGEVDNCMLNSTIVLGSSSVVDIINSVKKGTEDIVITNNGQEIARYVNYTELKSIEEKFDVEYSEGEVGDIALLSVVRPSVELRVENLESGLGKAETAINENADNIILVENDLEDTNAALSLTTIKTDATAEDLANTKVDLDNTNASLEKTNRNLAKTDSNLNTTNANLENTNANVSELSSNVEHHSTDINVMQNDLELAQEAIDYLIMNKTPINEEEAE